MKLSATSIALLLSSLAAVGTASPVDAVPTSIVGAAETVAPANPTTIADAAVTGLDPDEPQRICNKRCYRPFESHLCGPGFVRDCTLHTLQRLLDYFFYRFFSANLLTKN